MNENGCQTDLVYDELKISGNERYGFHPCELLVSSIVGCSGGVFRNILEKMRLSFNEVTISAQVERNEAKANRIETIHLIYSIYADNDNIAPIKIEQALILARKNCSMIQSVQNSITITEEFKMNKTHCPESE